MEKPTKEGLLAQEVLVLLQKLGWVAKLLNGVLGGGAHHNIDVVHGITIVLIPATGEACHAPQAAARPCKYRQ